MKLTQEAYILISNILDDAIERASKSDRAKIEQAQQELDAIGVY